MILLEVVDQREIRPMMEGTIEFACLADEDARFALDAGGTVSAPVREPPPIWLQLAPMMKPGSSPHSTRMWQSIEAVVLLPVSR